jgi:iron(III) transport system ATP-binding protein
MSTMARARSEVARDSAVAVHDLRKTYGDPKDPDAQYAVNGISFDVRPGEFVTLLGPSGCGKTTTLRSIAGLESATSGRIEMAGRVVFDPRSRVNVRTEDRPIAMVPQSYGIWPHMTVLDNAAFPMRHGRHRSRNKQDTKARAMAVLDQVGLAPMADRWATQLSGGQQQRLALARALLCDPEVLLLDEPLSNLDAKLRTKLRTELREFQEQFGVTSLYVTHDQAEALALSDTVIVMNHGVIEQIGGPEEIYAYPSTAYVADFIGSANLVAVSAASKARGDVVARTDLGTITCTRVPQPFDGGERRGGFVCIRPEQIRVRHATSGTPGAADVIRGRITFAEYLGDRVGLKAEANGVTLSVSAPAAPAFRVGDEVELRLDPDNTSYLSH